MQWKNILFFFFQLQCKKIQSLPQYRQVLSLLDCKVQLYILCQWHRDGDCVKFCVVRQDCEGTLRILNEPFSSSTDIFLHICVHCLFSKDLGELCII